MIKIYFKRFWKKYFREIEYIKCRWRNIEDGVKIFNIDVIRVVEDIRDKWYGEIFERKVVDNF